MFIIWNFTFRSLILADQRRISKFRTNTLQVAKQCADWYYTNEYIDKGGSMPFEYLVILSRVLRSKGLDAKISGEGVHVKLPDGIFLDFEGLCPIGDRRSMAFWESDVSRLRPIDVRHLQEITCLSSLTDEPRLVDFGIVLQTLSRLPLVSVWMYRNYGSPYPVAIAEVELNGFNIFLGQMVGESPSHHLDLRPVLKINVP